MAVLDLGAILRAQASHPKFFLLTFYLLFFSGLHPIA
jgi:hypothetical protein